MSNQVNKPATTLDEASRRYYLDVMGIQCWELRDNENIADADADVANAVAAGDEAAVSTLALQLPQLDAVLQQCSRCQLHTSRKQAISGRGNPAARLMFVVLAPDDHDDDAGVICSGAAGELFGKMLSAINIAIDDVYITSLLKCRVATRHTVTPQEIQFCNDYLKRQVQLVQPERLVVLGESAIRCLTQKNLSLDDFRALNAEPDYQLESVPVFASYSPQELLLQAENKRKAWSDLQLLQKMINS